MCAKNLTTSLKDHLYDDIKSRGWTFNELIEMGYEARIGKSKENVRLADLEADNIELRRRIAILAERLDKLTSRLLDFMKGGEDDVLG